MSVQIIQGNALNLPLEDNSVDLVVTSPPYFGLRSYTDNGAHYSGQLGSEPTPAEFIDALLAATREMVRCVKPSGSIWVNLGDKYVSDNRGSGTDVKRGQAKHAPAGPGGFLGRETARQKSLMGLPWRYAIACIDQLGLILRAEVIWAKPNGLPESVTDRVRRSHETWFHFSLQPRYYSAVDTIREAHQDSRTSPRRITGKFGGGVTDQHAQDPSGLSARMRRTPGDTEPRTESSLGKLPGSVWTIPTQPLTVPPELGVDHFAAFPMAWPRRIIQGWSPAGICIACGEGRRPVASSEITRDRGGRQFNPSSGNIGILGKERVTTITGETCGCEAPSWCKSCGASFEDCCRFEDNCCSGCQHNTAAPTRPAVILDPFGGTGTTALVASALGRHGISVDMSQDYNRLATWRCNDPGQIASAMQVDKPAPVADDQLDLFQITTEATA